MVARSEPKYPSSPNVDRPVPIKMEGLGLGVVVLHISQSLRRGNSCHEDPYSIGEQMSKQIDENTHVRAALELMRKWWTAGASGYGDDRMVVRAVRELELHLGETVLRTPQLAPDTDGGEPAPRIVDSADVLPHQRRTHICHTFGVEFCPACAADSENSSGR